MSVDPATQILVNPFITVGVILLGVVLAAVVEILGKIRKRTTHRLYRMFCWVNGEYGSRLNS
jgi:hypothetical protein